MATKVTIILAFLLVLPTCYLVLSTKEVYDGTSFPRKYLLTETIEPSKQDLENYLAGAMKILLAISQAPNVTDPNRALGVFYMKSILKRTVIENGNKISEHQYTKIKEILKQADYLMGHYFSQLRGRKWSDGLLRVSEILRDDTMQTHTISKFNRNRLAKWLISPAKVNNFAKAFDEATLPKEKYLKLVNSVKNQVYIISAHKSDECLSYVIYNRLYFDKHLRPCTGNQICADILYRSPSVAYSLSHRLLNILMPRQTRRCYMRSKEADDQLMDVLCAHMYRETVYLARRGYFFRDLFMEHIALCGLLGYREFFRRHWFRKVLSWVDKDGCIQENMNFEANRTKIELSRAKTEKKRNSIKERFREIFKDPCSYHQMALSLIVMAHGVRHAVKFMV